MGKFHFRHLKESLYMNNWTCTRCTVCCNKIIQNSNKEWHSKDTTWNLNMTLIIILLYWNRSCKTSTIWTIIYLSWNYIAYSLVMDEIYSESKLHMIYRENDEIAGSSVGGNNKIVREKEKKSRITWIKSTHVRLDLVLIDIPQLSKNGHGLGQALTTSLPPQINDLLATKDVFIIFMF